MLNCDMSVIIFHIEDQNIQDLYLDCDLNPGLVMTTVRHN